MYEGILVSRLSCPSQPAGFSEPGPEDPVGHQERRGLDEIKVRSALDPIDSSSFLSSWNLHKVDLFSAFISHSDDISSWKC